MQLTSPAFINNGEIPQKYTCKGQNINPPLEIIDAPSETKSFVLIFQDPDFIPKAYIHWLVFNIPGSVRTIDENSVPEGATVGLSSMKKKSYDGPCPKKLAGEHQCVFTLYALDTILDIHSKATTTMVLEAMTEHILASAELIGDVLGKEEIL